MLQAYNVKDKTKNNDILNAVITKTSKGAFMAQGLSASGDKLTTLVNKAKARLAFENGWAKPGWTDDIQAAIAELTDPAAAEENKKEDDNA